MVVRQERRTLRVFTGIISVLGNDRLSEIYRCKGVEMPTSFEEMVNRGIERSINFKYGFGLEEPRLRKFIPQSQFDEVEKKISEIYKTAFELFRAGGGDLKMSYPFLSDKASLLVMTLAE